MFRAHQSNSHCQNSAKKKWEKTENLSEKISAYWIHHNENTEVFVIATRLKQIIACRNQKETSPKNTK